MTPVRIHEGARVVEVHGPDDWVRLVSTYPLEVSTSRQHDWHRAVGASGLLVLPDWARVAEDWDGVHVTARGYLTTATRALAVGDATTVLAGWDPDATWWLSDCLSVAGETEVRAVPRR